MEARPLRPRTAHLSRCLALPATKRLALRITACIPFGSAARLLPHKLPRCLPSAGGSPRLLTKNEASRLVAIHMCTKPREDAANRAPPGCHRAHTGRSVPAVTFTKGHSRSLCERPGTAHRPLRSTNTCAAAFAKPAPDALHILCICVPCLHLYISWAPTQSIDGGAIIPSSPAKCNGAQLQLRWGVSPLLTAKIPNNPLEMPPVNLVERAWSAAQRCASRRAQARQRPRSGLRRRRLPCGAGVGAGAWQSGRSGWAEQARANQLPLASLRSRRPHGQPVPGLAQAITGMLFDRSCAIKDKLAASHSLADFCGDPCSESCETRREEQLGEFKQHICTGAAQVPRHIAPPVDLDFAAREPDSRPTQRLLLLRCQYPAGRPAHPPAAADRTPEQLTARQL